MNMKVAEVRSFGVPSRHLRLRRASRVCVCVRARARARACVYEYVCVRLRGQKSCVAKVHRGPVWSQTVYTAFLYSSVELVSIVKPLSLTTSELVPIVAVDRRVVEYSK